MIKGAGYCLTPGCPFFYKPAFFMGLEAAFKCVTCSEWGYLEPNKTWFSGYGLCREAKVHFRYDADIRRYMSTAVVTNDALDPIENTRTIHLNQPFIVSDKTALRMAEQAMANVASGHSGISIDLSGDKKLFEEAIAKLANSLETSDILRADLGSDFVPLGGSPHESKSNFR